MISKRRKVTAFLPCRSGSQRVANKNTRDFAGISGGLIKIKLSQLSCCEKIERIVVSTDDPLVEGVCNAMAETSNKQIEVYQRPIELTRDDISTDTLIRHVPSLINEETVLWTHVTSPFASEDFYSQAIERYFACLEEGYDSLMSVLRMKKFLWSRNGPVNYERHQTKWPRTQDLPEYFEVTSAVFISEIENYTMYDDRIGTKPYLFEASPFESFDIDWQQDFDMAEKLYEALATGEQI